MVNVKQYQIVSFANNTDPEVCKAKYITLLGNKNLTNDKAKPTNEITGKIADIRAAVIGGNSYYYIQLEGKDNYYKLSASDNDIVVIMRVGETVVVKLNGDADLQSEIIPADYISYK